MGAKAKPLAPGWSISPDFNKKVFGEPLLDGSSEYYYYYRKKPVAPKKTLTQPFTADEYRVIDELIRQQRKR